MGTIKLLLADDHLIIRDGIKLLLKKNTEIKVISEAENGEKVIDYLHYNSDKIDVVLMDISMPELGGIETTKIVCERFPHVRVLALTMHAEETYILSMLEAGALGYVLKDSGINELVAAIKSVHEGKKFFSKEASLTLINALMNNNKPKPLELTPRELEVLSYISKGMTTREIGTTLCISKRTVDVHRRNILSKLCVKNAAEMLRFAFENNLIT